MVYFIVQMLNSLIYFTQSFLVKKIDKEHWREDQDDREEEEYRSMNEYASVWNSPFILPASSKQQVCDVLYS